MSRNLTGLKPFKPGQSGNPAGRNGVLPPEIRSERKKNQAALIKLISEFFLMNARQARSRIRSNRATQLEKAVGSLIQKAIKGDVPAFKFMVELMVGKIPEHDYDGFTEEDLRILNRVKEVFEEQRRTQELAGAAMGAGDQGGIRGTLQS